MPVLLVSARPAPSASPPAPFALEHLVVQHEVACLVSHYDGIQEQSRFSIIRCVSSDESLQKYFLRVLGSFVGLLGSSPTSADVASVVNRLVELFRLMTLPPRKSAQGLWAELLVVAESTDPVALLGAWHVLPTDVYDFNAGAQRLEVKSTGGRRRQHRFSLAQLQPPPGTRVLVASVLAESAGGGTSLRELVDEVRSRVIVCPELASRVDQVVALSLGDSWRQAFDVRFDRELATSHLAFFDAAVIPCIDPNIPAGVSDVRFVADLDDVQQQAKPDLTSAGGLSAAALPRCW